ncbi:neuroepithelial cell-transforming gene 1 protein-like [Tympanuchus pallidicinctus]|uniref:neuroepithelial cell-transforming gene 1 protein-like n=1 Tax=Tympanuchus pallidicinctus TaxID=109042 RepID=UPI0022875CFA|nr:neuroepithelial cell-transforming gene 1 protein-like [Tympanuchus pallidicinctus]
MEAEPVGQKPPRRRRSRVSAGTSAGRSPPADSTPGGAASCSRCPLRRGSSFTFLTPGPHWDFTLKRKRRDKDDDVVSLCSLDFKSSETGTAVLALGYTSGVG